MLPSRLKTLAPRGEFLAEPVALLARMGSFDCAGLASLPRFAQDDRDSEMGQLAHTLRSGGCDLSVPASGGCELLHA